MNSENTRKLKQLAKDAGFLDDGDLLEFGEIIIEECLSVVTTSDAAAIRKHFGWKQPIDNRCHLSKYSCDDEYCPVHGRDIR